MVTSWDTDLGPQTRRCQGSLVKDMSCKTVVVISEHKYKQGNYLLHHHCLHSADLDVTLQSAVHVTPGQQVAVIGLALLLEPSHLLWVEDPDQ